MFEYPDLEGRPASVRVDKIFRFTKEYAEDLGQWVGHLHLRTSADVWTNDPDGVDDRLRTLKEVGGWSGLMD